jgi:protein regulator of cytokinesis 1
MQIETDLLNSLPKWEEANSRPFMVQGQRVIDTIYEAREAKEAAKEAKKVGASLCVVGVS